MPESPTMQKTMPETEDPENPEDPKDLSWKFLRICLEVARKLLDITSWELSWNSHGGCWGISRDPDAICPLRVESPGWPSLEGHADTTLVLDR